MSAKDRMLELDCKAALIVFNYYLNHAKNLEYNLKNKYVLSEIEMITLANAAAATAAFELRHAYPESEAITCRDIPVNSSLFYHNFKEVLAYNQREKVFALFQKKTKDWRLGQFIDFLIGAAKVFFGRWDGGYGGVPWVNCCWFAAKFLKEAQEGYGHACDISWEIFLCCCHNNRRWLNKLGNSLVSVLNMGLNAPPREILMISAENDPVEYCHEEYSSSGYIDGTELLVPDKTCSFFDHEDLKELVSIRTLFNPITNYWEVIFEPLMQYCQEKKNHG